MVRADEWVGQRARFLQHLLVRSERFSSPWIEGNRVTPKKLTLAERIGGGTKTALDVIANVRATEQAINELADPERTVTSGTSPNSST
ncbi:hypothetical protein [Gulosibacter bifidus]|uniref:Uncharacterized protein n=1 Tax=Gulosibacter bifidus TaxID=272239 RepID=A0ABW5RGL1_9MICO|nr:hypothetical protein [Gulosibacter bifidus]